MKYCYLNGEITLQENASIGVTDLTILRGYGVFDYFVFDEHGPRFLADYLERFYNSAEILNLTSPVSKSDLRQGVLDLIKANGETSGGIRLVLTGGYTEDSYTPTTGNIMILQSGFPDVPDELYSKGASVVTYQHQREFPLAKSLSYMTGIKLLPWLKEKNANYPLFHDGKYLRESDRSNYFMVGPEGQLITTEDKILKGITRARVIDVAKKLSINVELREVELSELGSATEVFFTSSIKGVLPITKVDDKPVGNGVPGPVTKSLQSGFLQLVSSAT